MSGCHPAYLGSISLVYPFQVCAPRLFPHSPHLPTSERASGREKRAKVVEWLIEFPRIHVTRFRLESTGIIIIVASPQLRRATPDRLYSTMRIPNSKFQNDIDIRPSLSLYLEQMNNLPHPNLDTPHLPSTPHFPPQPLPKLPLQTSQQRLIKRAPCVLVQQSPSERGVEFRRTVISR